MPRKSLFDTKKEKDAHSARVRKKVERNQSFSQQEMDEMHEFGEYFLDWYTDEEGYLNQEETLSNQNHCQ